MFVNENCGKRIDVDGTFDSFVFCSIFVDGGLLLCFVGIVCDFVISFVWLFKFNVIFILSVLWLRFLVEIGFEFFMGVGIGVYLIGLLNVVVVFKKVFIRIVIFFIVCKKFCGRVCKYGCFFGEIIFLFVNVNFLNFGVVLMIFFL